MAALAVLAAGAATVSWDAQYVMVRSARRNLVIAALEAGIPDAGALIFAALGIALALHGRRALRPRALNELAELRGEANKTISTVRMTMSRALAFLADPALAQAVLPDNGRSLDLEGFLRDRGTLYLIAETRGEDSPVAPLFACLAGEIHHTAAQTGQASPAGRLDPPLLMALVISSLKWRVFNVQHERFHVPGWRFIRGYLLPCP